MPIEETRNRPIAINVTEALKCVFLSGGSICIDAKGCVWAEWSLNIIYSESIYITILNFI